MKCQGFIKFRKSVLEKPFDHVTNAFVDFSAFFFEETVVYNFLSESMLKNIFQIGLDCFCFD